MGRFLVRIGSRMILLRATRGLMIALNPIRRTVSVYFPIYVALLMRYICLTVARPFFDPLMPCNACASAQKRQSWPLIRLRALVFFNRFFTMLLTFSRVALSERNSDSATFEVRHLMRLRIWFFILITINLTNIHWFSTSVCAENASFMWFFYTNQSPFGKSFMFEWRGRTPVVSINYYADIVIKKALSIGDLKDPTFAVEASICPQHAVCIGCFSGPGPAIDLTLF